MTTNVWLNDGGIAVPNDPEEVRCGAMRASMRRNVLISKPGVGEVNKSSFVDDRPDRVYGMPSPHDGESAKQGTREGRARGADVCARAPAGMRPVPVAAPCMKQPRPGLIADPPRARSHHALAGVRAQGTDEPGARLQGDEQARSHEVRGWRAASLCVLHAAKERQAAHT